MSKLEALKQTRQIAVDGLVVSLVRMLNSGGPISEVSLRDAWLLGMRKSPSIFPDGWYLPPPHGMEMMFGLPDSPRVRPKSTRPEEFWPRENIFLDKAASIAQVYASPVDRTTAMMGDFGLTLYFGNNNEVISHIKNTFDVTQEIAESIEVGMKLKDIARHGHELMGKKGIDSSLSSPTDPTGTNIGHTIPFSYEDMTSEQVEILGGADWEKTLNMLSRARKFLNAIEETKVVAGMALTVEPRPEVPGKSESMPAAWFHTIVLFHKDGRKEILSGFNEVFEAVGMDYMI